MVDEQILSKAQGGKEKAAKLKAVRAKELQVEQAMDSGMSDYLTTIDRLTAASKQRTANVADLSKLQGF